MYKQPTARRSGVALALASTILISAITAWAIQHFYSLAALAHGHHAPLALVWLLAFYSLAWSNILAALERPKKVSKAQSEALNKLQVAVIVPVYNEDPQLLKHCLASLLAQTRKPDQIVVVDDGSPAAYDGLEESLARNRRFLFKRTANAGKRHAQAVGIRLAANADIYLTVDSDTVLERRAIEEGLKPFADPAVTSVAGVCLPINTPRNLLTRFLSVWWVVSQLVDRSSLSVMNSVMVNSGGIAFYRGHIVRRYLNAYTSETFFGRPVLFSDDSLLTTYALNHGKTLQQPTAIGFTAIPENISHHLRQYTRWMRGSFIRSWWRFKYLPLRSYAFWIHFSKWLQLVITTLAFGYLLFTGSFGNFHNLLYYLMIPVLISYGQALRYLTIRRSDESFASQLATFATAPLMAFWSYGVLRFVRWYAYFTCLKTGWGTRTEVEVGLSNG